MKAKRVRTFFYRCPVSGCGSTFNRKEAWNIHHLFKHKLVKYPCGTCNKRFAMPSSYKDLRMTQVMNHYQWEQHCHFMCRATDHFARDCPHEETFHIWHKKHLYSKGVGLQEKVPAPKSPPQK